jgi:Tol biopolymer transport system component
MIDETTMDRMLRDHFVARADPSIIDGQADRVLLKVDARRQRPAGLVALRSSSMRSARPLAPEDAGRRVAIIYALGLLVILAIALAVAVATRPQTPFDNGLLAVIRDGDIHLVDPATGEEQPILADSGLTFGDPIWSPGGRYLLFRERNDVSYVLDMRTQDVRLLGSLGPAVWSPDGSRLAALEEASLRLIDPATGSRRDLVEAERDQGTLELSGVAPRPFDWSPDGRWLLAGGSKGLAGFADRDLVRIDVATGDSTVLVPAGRSSPPYDARWSPDGTRIVTITQRQCPDGMEPCPRALTIIDTDGTEVLDLTGVDTAVSDPEWSPDGRWIAYTSTPRAELRSTDGLSGTSVYGLSIAASDGSTQQLVAERVARWTWSPDGASLVYSSIDRFDQVQAATSRYDMTSGDYQDLGVFSEGFAWQPIRSGSTVPYLPKDPTVAEGPTDSIRPPATPVPGPDADPSGSAAGIAFDSGCQVLTYTFGASEPRLVASVPGCPASSSSTSTWAADGSAVIVTIDDTAMVIARDGAKLALLPVGQRMGYRWSPGGSFIGEVQCSGIECRGTAILRQDGSGRTEIPGNAWWSTDDTRLAVTDSEGRLFLGSGDGSDLSATDIRIFGPISWAPDVNRLAFVRDGNAWTAAADGSDQEQLTDFELGGVTSVAWSPDGRWIAMTRGTTAWLASADGSGKLRRAPVPETYRYYDLFWAPGGGRLAIAAWSERQLDTPAGWERTFLVSVDDDVAVELTSATDPSWSPDGRFLAVRNTATDTGGIDVLNADGSGRHAIPTGSYTPTWTKAWIP